jgi:HK97 family phage major capsid protein
MPSKLIEKRNELKAKQDKLHEVLKQMGDTFDLSKVTLVEGDAPTKAAAIKTMNKELTDLGVECDNLVEIEKAYTADQTRQKEAEDAARRGLPPARKQDGEPLDIGKAFVESPQFKAFTTEKRGRAGITVDVPLKVLMTTAAGFAPMSLRTGEVVPFVRRPPSVLDLIPVRPTSNAAIVYMEQTIRTNLAAEATEGAVLGEAALVYTQVTVPVENVGTWMPVTGQQLEDVDQIQGIINDELTQMLREVIDSQILNAAAATPPSLRGILANARIQTRGFAGDYFDTSFNAAKDVRITGRSTPSAYIFHPNDWAIIRLARTVEGIYILGNPNEVVDRLWGLQVVQSDAIAEKVSLCGAFADWVKLYEKRGVVVEMSDSEGTNFSHFIFAVRATVRVANVLLRPCAFCRFTRP